MLGANRDNISHLYMRDFMMYTSYSIKQYPSLHIFTTQNCNVSKVLMCFIHAS